MFNSLVVSVDNNDLVILDKGKLNVNNLLELDKQDMESTLEFLKEEDFVMDDYVAVFFKLCKQIIQLKEDKSTDRGLFTEFEPCSLDEQIRYFVCMLENTYELESLKVEVKDKFGMFLKMEI